MSARLPPSFENLGDPVFSQIPTLDSLLSCHPFLSVGKYNRSDFLMDEFFKSL